MRQRLDAVSIRSRLFEAGEPQIMSSDYDYEYVSIRSRLFEAGEHLVRPDFRLYREFQSAPASLRREN